MPAGHVASEGCTVLTHEPVTSEPVKDVTTIDWNADGSLLATGAYDGIVRVWTAKGELKASLSGHKGAIFSVKWNNSGTYLLTGSVDKSVAVWDASNGNLFRHFKVSHLHAYNRIRFVGVVVIVVVSLFGRKLLKNALNDSICSVDL